VCGSRTSGPAACVRCSGGRFCPGLAQPGHVAWWTRAIATPSRSPPALDRDPRAPLSSIPPRVVETIDPLPDAPVSAPVRFVLALRRYGAPLFATLPAGHKAELVPSRPGTTVTVLPITCPGRASVAVPPPRGPVLVKPQHKTKFLDQPRTLPATLPTPGAVRPVFRDRSQARPIARLRSD
jgi:hypothetical protein